MKPKDLDALTKLGGNFALPEGPKVITARKLRRKLHFMRSQINKQSRFVESLIGKGTDYEIDKARLHLAKLEGMQEAYESLLRSVGEDV